MYVSTGSPLPGMPGAQTGVVPIMRMFGVTAGGNSVCCHVHGFAPYLFVPVPEFFKPEWCDTFQVSAVTGHGAVGFSAG